MKIVTKQIGFTEKKNPQYLIYLKTDDNVSVECHEVEGDLNRVIRENELMEDHSVNNIRFVDYNTYRIESGLLDEGYPLILCFYLDRELITNPEIFNPFYETVNMAINSRDANILAFFMPCEPGSEKLECINPIAVGDSEMDKINKMVKEIAKQFDVRE